MCPCDSVGLEYPTAPHVAPVSAGTLFLCSSAPLSSSWGMGQTSGSRVFSCPLPQCICWGSVLLWKFLIMNRYSAMSLCQRGPSQRPCLALIAEIGVDPQLLWDFTVRAPSCGKVVGIALCFSSLCRRHGDLPWVLPWGGSPDSPMKASPKKKAGRWTDLLHTPVSVWENFR